MILPIYLYGQPVLKKVAEDITPEYPELKELIENKKVNVRSRKIQRLLTVFIICVNSWRSGCKAAAAFENVFFTAGIP